MSTARHRAPRTAPRTVSATWHRGRHAAPAFPFALVAVLAVLVALVALGTTAATGTPAPAPVADWTADTASDEPRERTGAGTDLPAVPDVDELADVADQAAQHRSAPAPADSCGDYCGTDAGMPGGADLQHDTPRCLYRCTPAN